ncbi:MAG: adaptor protein MecA [Ruminococcus sp.]|nr:adaptor protein MecA [Ruminococcus sp.]
MFIGNRNNPKVVTMTIEQIDPSKVMIVLGSSDMKDFSLEYSTLSFKDPHSRKILSRLLTLACSKTGMSIDNKKMLVEALPHKSGCLILLTLKPKTKRRVYRVKKPDMCLCCIFADVEKLISASVALRTKLHENKVYSFKDKYYLLIDENVALGTLALLEEFADCYVCSKISAAKVKEAGSYTGDLRVMADFFI